MTPIHFRIGPQMGACGKQWVLTTRVPAKVTCEECKHTAEKEAK